jgi:hypothetical protein
MKVQVLIEVDLIENDDNGIKTLRDLGIDYKEQVISIGKPDDNYLEIAVKSYGAYLEYAKSVEVLTKHIGTISLNDSECEIKWSKNFREIS